MGTLKLTLKKKWFDMIVSGEKQHEYREVKSYWTSRLTMIPKSYFKGMDSAKIADYLVGDDDHFRFDYDYVEFFNGGHYSEKLPRAKYELRYIDVREGLERWGAQDGKLYFTIHLGKEISLNNLPQ